MGLPGARYMSAFVLFEIFFSLFFLLFSAAVCECGSIILFPDIKSSSNKPKYYLSLSLFPHTHNNIQNFKHTITTIIAFWDHAFQTSLIKNLFFVVAGSQNLNPHTHYTVNITKNHKKSTYTQSLREKDG